MRFIKDLEDLPIGTIIIYGCEYVDRVEVKIGLTKTMVIDDLENDNWNSYYEIEEIIDYADGCSSRYVDNIEVAPDWIQGLFKIKWN